MFAIDNYDFTGKRAIIRVDFNVPLNGEGQVTDDTRIRAAIPTIKKVLEKGGAVILMSHLGRPKKNPDPKFSLEQIVPLPQEGVKEQGLIMIPSTTGRSELFIVLMKGAPMYSYGRAVPIAGVILVLFHNPPPLYTSHVNNPGTSEAGAIVQGIS